MSTDIPVNGEAPRRSGVSTILRSAATSPRLWVYLACTLAVVAISCILGKELLWDTLDYHFYAGFEALHDRLAQDYFAAGTQSYFNPYVYVPFYLLVRSGMPAFVIATVLAIAQSGILWLTYELAVSVAPCERMRTRIAAGILAAALALANPILINQIGSSYTDCLTAEAVLAGWLLLIRAVQAPSVMRVLSAGLILGAVSALKLTNSVHALTAFVLLLFLPLNWRARFRYGCLFGVALAIAFALVAAPWAVRLYQHFGNPFFPLFNNFFRSPHFALAPLHDQRFVPDSVVDALARPFTIALPLKDVHDEYSAPDIRYAVLCLLVACVLAREACRRFTGRKTRYSAPGSSAAARPLAALGCGFLADWLLWLTASGNGRYFIAMACVAAVLVSCLLLSLLATRRKACAYSVAAILSAQVFQLCFGATYRTHVPWNFGPWFQVVMPKQLAATSDLYFAFGLESNSFIVPFLPKRVGFVNLEGDYVIGTGGASGAHVESLVRRYSPNLRVIAQAGRFGNSKIPGLSHMDDTLAHFGLRVDEDDCSTIVVRDMEADRLTVSPGVLPVSLPGVKGKPIEIRVSPDVRLVTCRIVADSASHPGLDTGERRANLVFDRLENACPALFQPPRPVTEDFGDARHGYYWIRTYANTGLQAVIIQGAVKVVDPFRGGWPMHLGQESQWQRAPLRLACGRAHERYYARVVPLPAVGSR